MDFHLIYQYQIKKKLCKEKEWTETINTFKILYKCIMANTTVKGKLRLLASLQGAFFLSQCIKSPYMLGSYTDHTNQTLKWIKTPWVRFRTATTLWGANWAIVGMSKIVTDHSHLQMWCKIRLVLITFFIFCYLLLLDKTCSEVVNFSMYLVLQLTPSTL